MFHETTVISHKEIFILQQYDALVFWTGESQKDRQWSQKRSDAKMFGNPNQAIQIAREQNLTRCLVIRELESIVAVDIDKPDPWDNKNSI